MSKALGASSAHLPPEMLPKTKLLTFRTMSEAQCDWRTWPEADPPTPDEVRKAHPHFTKAQARDRAWGVAVRYERLRRAVVIYLVDGRLAAALAEAECGARNFYWQLNRCLVANQAGGAMVGWAGLIYQRRIAPKRRSSELIVTRFDLSEVVAVPSTMGPVAARTRPFKVVVHQCPFCRLVTSFSVTVPEQSSTGRHHD